MLASRPIGLRHLRHLVAASLIYDETYYSIQLT